MGQAARLIAAIAAVLLLVGVVWAQAQQAVSVHRIGFVASGMSGPSFAAFRQGLRDAGYVEGKDVVIEARFADGRFGRLPGLIADVVRLNVDVLVVGSTPAALAAKRATTSVPIVFAGLFDPVEAGVVPNLARPGGNITGSAIGISGSGFAGKWLELLKEVAPRISRVAVLWNSQNPASTASVRELEAAARTFNVTFETFDAGNATTLDRALAAIAASGAHALVVTNDPFFTPNHARLVRFAATRRVPAVYYFRVFADAGGLMTYGASVEESHRRAAAYVDRILKGTKPGDLPIEQPTRFELVVNLRTATSLGLTVPQA
ncbi:MAG TPA: ABC transporter substrate-binding protein, partial [Methylomirabilota bacterium]|nr:ABC transporter substrate-binding protein [Methylomirabilota bacterium]